MGDPAIAAAAVPQTHFSADGFWWWDGAEWKPALSQDRLWRWNGQSWEPARAAGAGVQPSGSGAGVAAGISVAIFLGVVALVALVTLAVLYFMGGAIADVYSNVATSLTSR